MRQEEESLPRVVSGQSGFGFVEGWRPTEAPTELVALSQVAIAYSYIVSIASEATG